MEKADKLSRRPNWKVSVEKNNKNQTSIKEQWICSLVEVVIELPKEVVNLVEIWTDY